MKTSLLVTSFSLVASTLAWTPPPVHLPVVKAIKSETWTQCAPGQINVSLEREKFRLDMSAVRFGVYAHDQGPDVATCQFTMELTSWLPKYRVRVNDLTYRGNISLDKGVSLHMNASTVLQYENNKRNPMNTQPYIWNLSSSTMMENTAPHAIGGYMPFDGAFRIEAWNRNITWSPCFDGHEGAAAGDDKTKLVVSITARKRAARTDAEAKGHLTGGLGLDLGLVWEECAPDRATKNSWGDTRIDDWRTCSFRSENRSSAQMWRRGVFWPPLR
ncbi:hypothetical protein F5X99DRAFT_413857 [Biscogniauxia marginata]|nr:hypothetical protein F5X99DRAFT_413857 [Biscogniauxia marginata]